MSFGLGLAIGILLGLLGGAGAVWFFFSLAEEGSAKVAGRAPEGTKASPMPQAVESIK